MSEMQIEALCRGAQSFYERGYAHGSTGNLSVRCEEDVYLTPTGKSLSGLEPASLSVMGIDGSARNAMKPTKEYPFHLGIYRARADVRAIVHLHSFYATALSCLEKLDAARPMPAITPYYFMRVHPLGIVGYHRPGSTGLAAEIEAAIVDSNVLLMRNHGLIACGATFEEATDRAEELEQTARLYFQLQGHAVRELSAEEIAELK